MKQNSTRSFNGITEWLRVGLAVFLAVQWRHREKKQARFHVDGETLDNLCPDLNHSEAQLLFGAGVSG